MNTKIFSAAAIMIYNQSWHWLCWDITYTTILELGRYKKTLLVDLITVYTEPSPSQAMGQI